MFFETVFTTLPYAHSDVATLEFGLGFEVGMIFFLNGGKEKKMI
jgi:hypothetical protein